MAKRGRPAPLGCGTGRRWWGPLLRGCLVGALGDADRVDDGIAVPVGEPYVELAVGDLHRVLAGDGGVGAGLQDQVKRRDGEFALDDHVEDALAGTLVAGLGE